MTRLSWSILLLFSLVLALWMGHKVLKTAPVTTTTEEEYLIPDYVATDMRTTLYDKQGIARSFMSAVKMEHYNSLGFTNFSKPVYTLVTEKNSVPWQLTAKEATLYTEDKLVFENQVELNSIDEKGYLRKITTQYLEVDLSSQTMYTDQKITMLGHNFKVEGIGMNGNLGLKKINLLNHTKTVYQHAKS